MSPQSRREIVTGRAVVPRTPGVYNSRAASQGRARVSAAIVLIFILASTAISLYDLRLLIKLLGR